MRLTYAASLLLAATSAIAMPAGVVEDNALSKRTCWELKGNALSVCQLACRVACDAVTGTLAKGLCKKACDAGPSNIVRDEISGPDDAAVAMMADIEAASPDELVEVAKVISPEDMPVSKRSVGHEACIAACEVLCNSTVLALLQRTCLDKCKPKCS